MFIGFFALCSAPLTKVGFGTCLFFSRAYPPLRRHPHVVMMCERDSGLSMATDCCQQKFECRNKFSIVGIKFYAASGTQDSISLTSESVLSIATLCTATIVSIHLYCLWDAMTDTKSQWNIWIPIFEYNKHCTLIWVSRQCLSSDYCVIYSHGHLQQAVIDASKNPLKNQ